MRAMDNSIILFSLLASAFYLTDTSSPGNVASTNSQTTSTCGISVKSRIDNKIVGGNSSNIATHPWFAALAKRQGADYIVACGATLITSTHLITAAHCYDGNTGGTRENRFIILFNLQNRCNIPAQSTAGNGNTPTVRTVIIHKKYGKGSHLPENDIAMIVLHNPVSNTPICLPSKQSYDGSDAVIIGYGSTKVRSTDDTYPCQLKEANIKIYSRQQCLNSGIGNNLAQKAICAGRMEGGVDACDGDSGGPLMVKVNNRYELIGVTSYGEGCGRKNYPGVYTDLTVNGQGRWIQKRLAETSGTGGQSPSQQTGASGGGQVFPQRPPKPSKPVGPTFPGALPPHWAAFLNGGFLPPLPLLPPFMDTIDMMDPMQAEMLYL